MLARFWGTRGSLPVAPRADALERKLANALLAASGRSFADTQAALAFVREELPFAAGRTYGGASACVEIEGAPDGSYIVCDMGSGLREFGVDALRRCGDGHAKLYHIFLSHLHWDHIMGFPFFGPAFDPASHIIIHAGHADAEQALRRQQEEISFPVPFDGMRARIDFHTLTPGETYAIAGLEVSLTPQYHSHTSYAWRFDRGDKAVIFSTDAEHPIDDMEDERAFAGFFADADLCICDTMYSIEDSVTLKADWGHSSSIVAVDLCRRARAKRMAMFHHEPAYSDEDIETLHRDTIRYEAENRGDGPALEVICAYDGLEIAV